MRTPTIHESRSNELRMNATFKIWRGDARGGEFCNYTTEVSEGMVVLDAVNHIQATQANDLACRWNCKAGKCGSCSAEVNGMPKLMCMTRMIALRNCETRRASATAISRNVAQKFVPRVLRSQTTESFP